MPALSPPNRRCFVRRPGGCRAERFQQGLDALAAFVEREGHARVPQSRKTAEGLALGVWLNNTRARRDKLSEEQAGRLEGLGVAW